jgi:membrane protease YdiL (CAAX protease family)
VTAAILAGALAQALAWVVVRRRGASVWTTTAPVLAVLGVVAIVVAGPALSAEVSVPLALGIGVVVGAALYAATFVFVRLVGPRWRALDAQARTLYAQRSRLSAPLAIAVAAGIAAVGEELFWRGLVVDWAKDALGANLEAGVVTWVGYVVVNGFSANLAIVAGAVVGGAVWTALAIWSGGVLASIACHACWTGLMLARPVIGGRAGP